METSEELKAHSTVGRSVLTRPARVSGTGRFGELPFFYNSGGRVEKISTNMDSVDTDEFKDIFSMFDKRGDGKIECIEIGNLIRTLGLNPSQIDIDKMIKDVDPSGKKRITFEEFLPLYMTQSQKKTAAGLDHFLEAFRVFDKDSTGTISAAELRHVLTCLGEKLTEEDIENLFSGLEDSHGQINYEEMVKMVYSG